MYAYSIHKVSDSLHFFSYFIYIHIYLYLMTTDRIGLNPRIKGEIRHRSVANGLHNFLSVTNPLAFGLDQNPRIGSDRIDGLTDFLYTPTKNANLGV